MGKTQEEEQVRRMVEIIKPYLDDYYHDLRSENTELKRVIKQKMMDNWIDVNDRLPEDNCQKLVFSKGRCFIADHWTLTRKWLSADARAKSGVKVTHWQPLPEPPKE